MSRFFRLMGHLVVYLSLEILVHPWLPREEETIWIGSLFIVSLSLFSRRFSLTLHLVILVKTRVSAGLG